MFFDEDRRADTEGAQIRSVGKGAPAATGKMARSAGCRSAPSTALCRSCCERTIAGDVSKTHRAGARNPPVFGRSGVCGGGDADFANGGRRRSGGAIQHAPQSSRTRFISPHRSGTLLKTPVGRRIYQSVRNEPEFPKRRYFAETQSGVHDARNLLGLRRFRKNGEPDRGIDLPPRRKIGGRRAVGAEEWGTTARAPPDRPSRCRRESDKNDQSEAAVATGTLCRSGPRSRGQG